jgi:FdhD protein
VFGHIMDDLVQIRVVPVALSQARLYALLKTLNGFNEVYRSAGAVHGCALCEDDRVLLFIEDVGRHNAVDAIAGSMWIDDISGASKIFYTTGRLTSEMVIKVGQMGIPVLMSRSGVTQMGLKIARDLGVTLLSRVQGRHFLVYNGAENIVRDVALPPKADIANVVQRAGE